MKLRDLVNAHIRDLAPYVPGKPVEELERELGIASAVKLASNESPIGPSRRAVEAIFAAAENLNRYPDDTCFVLRDAAGDAPRCRPRRSSASPAARTASSSLLAKCFLAPGDEALFPWPSFAMYPILTKGAGATPVQVPLDREHRADVAGAARARSRRARACSCPREPEQPDRHLDRRGRLREAWCASCPSASCSPPTRRTSSSCAGRDFPDSVAAAARAPDAGRPAHVLEGVRAGGPAHRLRDRATGADRLPRARAPPVHREQPGAGRRGGGARRPRAHRAHPRTHARGHRPDRGGAAGARASRFAETDANFLLVEVGAARRRGCRSGCSATA